MVKLIFDITVDPSLDSGHLAPLYIRPFASNTIIATIAAVVTNCPVSLLCLSTLFHLIHVCPRYHRQQ